MEAILHNNLPKKERLHGKTDISRLLAGGRHGSVQGMRYLYLADTGNCHSRILISVPKKSFKRAVKRNLLKRRIRESWRKQKHSLTVEGGVDILFMYATKEILEYNRIYELVGHIIEKINKACAPADHNEESECDGQTE